MFGSTKKVVVEVDKKDLSVVCITGKRLSRAETREILHTAYELLRTNKRHRRK